MQQKPHEFPTIHEMIYRMQLVACDKVAPCMMAFMQNVVIMQEWVIENPCMLFLFLSFFHPYILSILEIKFLLLVPHILTDLGAASDGTSSVTSKFRV